MERKIDKLLEYVIITYRLILFMKYILNDQMKQSIS